MSERFRKGLSIILALTLVAALFSMGGCAAEEEPAEEPVEGEEPAESGVTKGGTFSYFIVEPDKISPTFAYESEGIQVVQAVFDSLVGYDPITNELVPAAAESWEPNETGDVWTFNLVEDATFHNGDPVTAADFKYAFERMANPANESWVSYHLAAIKGFEAMQAGEADELEGIVAVDDHTLEITLAYPYFDFEYVVGHPDLGPLPKAEVEADPDAFDENPIGNGPFMMSEPWVHDQYIALVKYDGYYGQEPNIDGVEFRIFKDEQTAFLEFEAGNLDFTQIPVGQLATVAEQYGESADGYTVQPGQQVLTGPELGIYYALINNTKAPFDDVNVRKAVNLAINREAIIDANFEGTRVPATSVSPRGVVGWEADLWEFSHYDGTAAAAALAEAGYAEGAGFPEITLDINTGSGHEDIFQMVQADLAAIGINGEIAGTEWAEYKAKLDGGTFDIGRYGWIADYPIMDNFLYSLFHSESGDNVSGYANSAVDDQLITARQTADPEERAEAYREVERLLSADMPVAPIMYYSHMHVGSDRIHDMVYSPMNIIDFQNVWISE